MLKKVILLFLISFSWQLNLSSMFVQMFIKKIDNSSVKCTVCGFSLLNADKSLILYKCSNGFCGRYYELKNPESNEAKGSAINIMQNDNDNEKETLENIRSNKTDIDASEITDNLASTLQKIKLSSQKNEGYYSPKKKYAISLTIILGCCIACKYHKQIKKFLFDR